MDDTQGITDEEETGNIISHNIPAFSFCHTGGPDTGWLPEVKKKSGKSAELQGKGDITWGFFQNGGFAGG